MTTSAPKRKRSRYSGALAEPLYVEPLIAVPAERSRTGSDPQTADRDRALQDRIKRKNTRLLLAGREDRTQKLRLLAKHFGIETDPLPPGWARDLALCLARRHERLFAKGSNIRYSELFAKYGIDPDDSSQDADFRLAYELASKHVPGFDVRSPEPPQSRFSTLELTSLFLAVVDIRDHLQASGKPASDRAVVRILRNPRGLAAIMPKAAADEITQTLALLGNADRGAPRPLSERALREYLAQLRTAWSAYKAGTATPFQKQFVREVIPLLLSLGKSKSSKLTDLAGQIEAAKSGS